MHFDSETPDLRSAHVVVVGNEKGGAGKSTLSIHLAVALLKLGHRVACIDLDSRQQTMTRFFENRESFARHAGWKLEAPRHCAVARASEAREFSAFADAVAEVEHGYEFVVIDTPANDSHLMRLAHSLADTLLSPLNDSFFDIDVFSRVHHDRGRRGAVAHYAELVLQARGKRRMVDNGVIDWVAAPNRIATLASHNGRQVAVSLGRLARELGFRVVEGLHERVIFRELFPIGLTALDPIEEADGRSGLTASQASARREIERLLQALDLPTRGGGIKHEERRRLWRERVLGAEAEKARERGASGF